MRSEKMKDFLLIRGTRCFLYQKGEQICVGVGSFEEVPTGGVCFLRKYEVIN